MNEAELRQALIVKELEKIKDETLSECPNTNTRIICMSIIDKHIAELKGENK